jgi:hypothetical protein
MTREEAIEEINFVWENIGNIAPALELLGDEVQGVRATSLCSILAVAVATLNNRLGPALDALDGGVRVTIYNNPSDRSPSTAP